LRPSRYDSFGTGVGFAKSRPNPAFAWMLRKC
jgi:hypothetical protein